MISTINPAKDKALAFASRGHPILPLHGVTNGRCDCEKRGCSHIGKHPIGALTPHGLLEATTDPKVISEWFDMYPNMNYGIRCTKITVVDIDPRDGGDKSWRALTRKASVPHTWRVKSGGGGDHIMFEDDTDTPCRDLAKGVQLKGKDGYVVGPGSMHESGKRYAFYADCRPKDTPLAPLPAWVKDLAGNPKGKGAKYTNDELNALMLAVDEGERNNRVTKIFGHLYGSLRPDKGVLCELVYAWNMQNCKPPLPADEVLGIARNVLSSERKKREGSQ